MTVELALDGRRKLTAVFGNDQAVFDNDFMTVSTMRSKPCPFLSSRFDKIRLGKYFVQYINLQSPF